MPLLLLPGGGTALAPTAADLRAELYPYLNSRDAADLEYWTEAELLAWLNAGADRLARRVAALVERDTNITVVAGTSTYTLPARHLTTIHVSVGGAVLRAGSRAELEALDSTWKTASGALSHYLQDHGAGLASIRLYKIPAAGGTLAIVEAVTPAALASTADLTLPDELADYAFLYALGEARRRESDGAMPEVALACDQLMGLYEQVAREYWGASL
jgi:hypothetical protein